MGFQGELFQRVDELIWQSREADQPSPVSPEVLEGLCQAPSLSGKLGVISFLALLIAKKERQEKIKKGAKDKTQEGQRTL